MLQFFAFSLLASLLPLSAPVESPVLSESISNRNIKSITEDSRGYIWIGTYRGLNRFNGREYRQYYSIDDDYGLPGNQAIDVFCDSRGRLWAATTNGIAIYDAERDDFRRVCLDDIYLTANMELTETFDGRILLNTRLSVFEYDEEDSLKQVSPPRGCAAKKREGNFLESYSYSVERYSYSYSNMAGVFNAKIAKGFAKCAKAGLPLREIFSREAAKRSKT